MKEITAYQCDLCKEIYVTKYEATRCCHCKQCKHYIGKVDRQYKWVHCSKGFTCDSYYSKGKSGTFEAFEEK